MQFSVGIIFIALFTCVANAKHPAIDKARSYLKSRERQLAIETLNIAISLETKVSHKNELQAELAKTLELFLYDKGQKAFESAEISRFAGQPSALSKYEESLAIEGDNSKILSAMTLIHLRKGECEKAQNYIQRLRSASAESQTGRYLEVAARICQMPATITQEDLSLLKAMKEFFPMNLGLIAKAEFLKNNISAAEQSAKEAIAADAGYPSAYFWAYKSLKQEGQPSDNEAEKFVETCRALNLEQRKKYQWDPDLCKDLDVVEKSLKVAEGTK